MYPYAKKTVSTLATESIPTAGNPVTELSGRAGFRLRPVAPESSFHRHGLSRRCLLRLPAHSLSDAAVRRDSVHAAVQSAAVGGAGLDYQPADHASDFLLHLQGRLLHIADPGQIPGL